jgi:hypothetical protein
MPADLTEPGASAEITVKVPAALALMPGGQLLSRQENGEPR